MPQPILVQNYNVSQPWLTQPFLVQRAFTAGGSDVTIEAGRVMGVILSTQKVALQAAANTDGSEMPRFLNYESVVVPAGNTVSLWLSEKGEFAEDAVVLTSPDTLATVVRTTSTGGGSIRDLLNANAQIILRTRTQNSGYDNPIPAV